VKLQSDRPSVVTPAQAKGTEARGIEDIQTKPHAERVQPDLAPVRPDVPRPHPAPHAQAVEADGDGRPCPRPLRSPKLIGVQPRDQNRPPQAEPFVDGQVAPGETPEDIGLHRDPAPGRRDHPGRELTPPVVMGGPESGGVAVRGHVDPPPPGREIEIVQAVLDVTREQRPRLVRGRGVGHGRLFLGLDAAEKDPRLQEPHALHRAGQGQQQLLAVEPGPVEQDAVLEEPRPVLAPPRPDRVTHHGLEEPVGVQAQGDLALGVARRPHRLQPFAEAKGVLVLQAHPGVGLLGLVVTRRDPEAAARGLLHTEDDAQSASVCARLETHPAGVEEAGGEDPVEGVQALLHVEGPAQGDAEGAPDQGRARPLVPLDRHLDDGGALQSAARLGRGRRGRDRAQALFERPDDGQGRRVTALNEAIEVDVLGGPVSAEVGADLEVRRFPVASVPGLEEGIRHLGPHPRQGSPLGRLQRRGRDVHGQDHVRPHPAGHPHGNVVGHSPVHQERSLPVDGGEENGDGEAGPRGPC
jgi:hypothetical protein